MGSRASSARARARENSGLSGSRARTMPPIPTSTMLRRNGRRQPQLEKCVVGQARRQRERRRRQQEPCRRTGLRPAPVEASLALGRVLDRHQHCTAPLAAEAEALHEPQRDERDRRTDPDRTVRRQQADGEGGRAHEHQRQAECRLPADAIAEVPEHDPADRPRHEADRKRREREQRPHERIEAREEELREDQRRRSSVEKEVVPLDRGADERRQENEGHARGAHRSGECSRQSVCGNVLGGHHRDGARAQGAGHTGRARNPGALRSVRHA